MQFEIKYKGVHYGTVTFDVEPSFYEPILSRLGFFGMGFEPIPDPPTPQPVVVVKEEKKARKRG